MEVDGGRVCIGTIRDRYLRTEIVFRILRKSSISPSSITFAPCSVLDTFFWFTATERCLRSSSEHVIGRNPFVCVGLLLAIFWRLIA